MKRVQDVIYVLSTYLFILNTCDTNKPTQKREHPQCDSGLALHGFPIITDTGLLPMGLIG